MKSYDAYFATQSSVLEEGRNVELKYKEEKTKGELTKVIVALEGNASQQASKLAKRFARLKKSSDLISKATKEINEKLTSQALGYFDEAADKIATRVVQTASFVISVSKDPVQSEKTEVNYEALYADIIKLIDSSLQPQITALLDAHTKKWTPEAKKPSMTVKPMAEDLVDEGLLSAAANKLEQWVEAITGGLKSFRDHIAGWGRGYDLQLNALKKQAKVK